MQISGTERTVITQLTVIRYGLDWTKTFKLTIGKIQLAENSQSRQDEIIK